MKNVVISFISALFNMVSTEDIRDFIDAGLDKLEDKYIEGVVDTPKEVAISGVIKTLRSLLSIKDEDYGSDKVSA